MRGPKKFLHLLRGVQKVLAACEGGSKKFDDKKFQLPSPHQSIYEHSLNMQANDTVVDTDSESDSGSDSDSASDGYDTEYE